MLFGFVVACGDSGSSSGGASQVALCSPGQTLSCAASSCGGGAVATAQCMPSGAFGACLCPGGAAAAASGSGAVNPTAAAPGAAGSGSGGAGATLPRSGTTQPGQPGTPIQGAAGAGPESPTGATAPPPNTWRMMGYDTTNQYHNPIETILSVDNAAMLKEKWRFSVAGFPPGSPVIAEGKVFVMATGGTYGIGFADGKKLWERTDVAGTASAAYDDGYIYVHDTAAKLYKLKASDGSTVWGPVLTFDVKDCDGTSSPIVAKNMVFVGHGCGPKEMAGNDLHDALGGVEAFDTATGNRVWTYFTVPKTGMENGAMVWSTVSVDQDAKMLFAATGNNYSVQGENSDAIHAVDLMTGMKLWKTQIRDNDTWSLMLAPQGPDSDFGANPILAEIAGQKVVADGDKGSAFHVFDRMTGRILWERKDLSTSRDATHGGMLMNGGFDGKYFYVVSNQPPKAAVLHALDPAKMGADAWPALTLSKTTWGAPSTANGVLLVPSDDDLLVMNAMTGAKLATLNTGGSIAAGAPAIVDGHVVVASGLSYYLDSSAKNNNQIICYAVPGAIDTAPPTSPPPTGAAGGPANPGFTPGSATFSAIWQEIIVNVGCNGGASCHASSAGGGLVMQNKADTYTSLVNAKAMGTTASGTTPTCANAQLTRVTPGMPDDSLLVNKLEAATPKCGIRMPPGGMVTAAQMKQVRDWITAGAQNN